MLIIVFHPSSVLVTMRAKEKFTYFFTKNSSRQSFWSLTGIRGSFAGPRLCVAGIPGENKKRRLVIIMAAMVRLHNTQIWSPESPNVCCEDIFNDENARRPLQFHERPRKLDFGWCRAGGSRGSRAGEEQGLGVHGLGTPESRPLPKIQKILPSKKTWELGSKRP